MKKFLTFVLVLAMVLSVSSFAMADVTLRGNGNDEADPYLVKTEEELIAAAAAGGYIRLDGSFDVDEAVVIPEGVTVVLDLNGKTITGTDTTTKNFGLITLANDGKAPHVAANLTVKDSAGGGNVTLIAENDTGWNRLSAVIFNQQGTVKVEGGTFQHFGGTSMSYGIDNLTNGGVGDAELTITGGTIISTYAAVRLGANSDSKTSKCTISAGSVEGGNYGVLVHDFSSKENKADLDINGGEFTGTKGALRVWDASTSKSVDNIDVDITNGNFDGALMFSITGVDSAGDSSVSDFFTISGGTFTEDPSACLASNCVVNKNADGNYVPAAATPVTAPSSEDDATATPNTGEIVKITKEQVNALADGKSLVVTADEMTFTFSKDLLSGLLSDGGSYVAIKIKEIDQNELNEAQYEAIRSTTAQLVFTAEIYVDGEYVGDKLDGKTVAVLIPVSAAGLSSSGLEGYSLVYISDDGKLEIIANAEAGANVIEAKLSHFSEYAVIKTEDANKIIASQKTPATSSSGGGYSGPDVWYIGGNTFGTNTNQVPTSVEIDQVPVSFTMNGSQITVDCITPGAKWVKVSWGSTTNTRYFTPDANAYCAQAVIPKTGGMSFWAAIAQFLGF